MPVAFWPPCGLLHVSPMFRPSLLMTGKQQWKKTVKNSDFEEGFEECKEQPGTTGRKLQKVERDTTVWRRSLPASPMPQQRKICRAKESLLEDPATTLRAFQDLLWMISSLTLWPTRCAPGEHHQDQLHAKGIQSSCVLQDLQLDSKHSKWWWWEGLLQKVFLIQTKMLGGDTLGDMILPRQGKRAKRALPELWTEKKPLNSIWIWNSCRPHNRFRRNSGLF